jgi:hypothetical protein
MQHSTEVVVEPGVMSKVIEFGSKFVSELIERIRDGSGFEREKFDRWKRPFVMCSSAHIADKGKKVVEPLQVSATNPEVSRRTRSPGVRKELQKEGCEISVRMYTSYTRIGAS